LIDQIAGLDFDGPNL